jgi:hypothetical protein
MSSNVTFYIGDITKPEDVANALEKVSIFIVDPCGTAYSSYTFLCHIAPGVIIHLRHLVPVLHPRICS